MRVHLQHIKNSATPLKDLHKVFLCAEDSDREKFKESLAKDLFDIQSNISLWFPEETECDLSEEDRESWFSDLREMNLFIIPVTKRFLYTDNDSRLRDFSFALEQHIPVLPILQEQGLESVFNDICGNLQCLNKFDPDPTALPYEEKLKLFLDTVLLKDKTIEKIRNAFAAYIFLSYRKKDRKYAQEVMRLIHKNPFTRDVAIWYDEFLTPGEDFNDSIRAAFEKSSLFSMVVTPSLLEIPNYVMTTEYPMAIEAGKKILPIMAVPTDAAKLAESYPEIPEWIKSDDSNADHIGELIRQALMIRPNDDPEHKFFMGLAYLTGIDLEIDHEKATTLITEAAESGIGEACLKLTAMYENAQGVERDYIAAAGWQQRYVECLERELHEGNMQKDLRYTFYRACAKSVEKWLALYRFDQAWSVFGKVMAEDEKKDNWKESIARIELYMYASRTALVQKRFADTEQYLTKALELSKSVSSLMKEYEQEKNGGMQKSELMELMYRADLARQLGEVKKKQKKWQEAIDLYVEAIPFYEKIIIQEPRLKKQLILLYMHLGDAWFRQDKSSHENRMEAEKNLVKNLELAAQYREEDPSFASEELEYTIISRSSLIEICLLENRIEEAKTRAAAFLQETETMYQKEESVKAGHFLVLAYIMNATVAEKQGDVSQTVKWYRFVVSTEEEIASCIGIQNVALQLKVYYKNLLKALQKAENWELHREYTGKLEQLAEKYLPNDGAVIADIAFHYSKQKDIYSLGKSYEYYDHSLDLFPGNETNKKNRSIVEKQLKDAIIRHGKEEDADAVGKTFDLFQKLSEKYPQKDGIILIRDLAKDYLALILSRREDIESKERACGYYVDLAKCYPEKPHYDNNLRITRVQIAFHFYRLAEEGDKVAAKKAYELYSSLEENYPGRDYGKNAMYVKNHFM